MYITDFRKILFILKFLQLKTCHLIFKKKNTVKKIQSIVFLVFTFFTFFYIHSVIIIQLEVFLVLLNVCLNYQSQHYYLELNQMCVFYNQCTRVLNTRVLIYFLPTYPGSM